AAVALALSRPVLVEQLVLAWPPTAGDPEIDTPRAAHLIALGADQTAVDALLGGGGALRGFSDDQLTALAVPVGILPATGSRYHRRDTVDALLKVIPGAVELSPATPPSPSPDFSPHLGGFITA